MSIRSRLTGFVERVGGMIVAPRSTLSAAQQGGGGGLDDLFLLVALSWLGTQLSSAVRGVLFAVDLGLLDGLLIVASGFARVLVLPFLAALAGGLLLAVAARVSAGAAGKSGASALDLAALCALPGVGLEVLAAVVQRLLHLPVPRTLVLVAGGLWMLGLLLLAGLLRRHRLRDDEVAS